ncbi:MAG TPA: hypothetical protein IGS52_12570 [Oscillatoriaceae cyanobacterium M33_DOE_052]|uniref:HEAT repeat domain-containing protein n=1 Tax=Planktothricoides sp. SpSt-374 TaxID=2282167 RepID=A0A7C3ZLB1_9CYAN|nr:hypothetical protein [Oscillatoriaceae cyanobacterium M33_DOE_052]
MIEDKSVKTSNVQNSVISTGNVVGNITNTHSTSAQQKNLTEAAAEIQQLLAQLSQSYPTTTAKEKRDLAIKAIEEIDKNPDIKAKVINALRAGGTAALMELINNPVVRILTPMLDSLLEDAN